MALWRAGPGLVVIISILFIFLVVAPVSVLGGRTRLLHEEEVTGDVSGNMVLLEGSREGSGGFGDRIGGGCFGRRMFAAEGPGQEASKEQLDGHDTSVEDHSTVPSAETPPTVTAPKPPKVTAPTPPSAGFAARFAFLFRSLAKGGSPPSTGTPSPGHN